MIGILHLDEVDARRRFQKGARLLVDAETAADVARIVVRDLLSAGRRRHQAAFLLVDLCDEARELAHLAREHLDLGEHRRIVLEDLDVRLLQGFRAGRASREDGIGVRRQDCLDVLLRELPSRVTVAHAHGRLPAAALILREEDGDAGILQHAHGIFRRVREDEVHVAAREEDDAHLRILRVVLFERLGAVAERRIGDGRQTAVVRHLREEQRQMANELAARHRLLRLRADPQQRMEDLAVREDVLEHRLFCKRHAVFLHVP